MLCIIFSGDILSFSRVLTQAFRTWVQCSSTPTVETVELAVEGLPRLGIDAAGDKDFLCGGCGEILWHLQSGIVDSPSVLEVLKMVIFSFVRAVMIAASTYSVVRETMK